MSGFFMIKREVVQKANLNPKGFKILLEIIIKGDYKNIKEIPISFINRKKGKSKANLKEIFYYLENLIGYLKIKKKIIWEFLKFGVVGLLGTAVNILVLYLLTEKIGIHYIISAVFSFIVAMTHNFFLNKIWTFKEKMRTEVKKKYTQFALVSVSALAINILFLYIFTEFLKIYYLISQVLSIFIAFTINFLGNKIFTFSK